MAVGIAESADWVSRSQNRRFVIRDMIQIRWCMCARSSTTPVELLAVEVELGGSVQHMAWHRLNLEIAHHHASPAIALVSPDHGSA